MASKPEQIADPIETFDYVDAEVVVELVRAVGTDYGPIREFLIEALLRYGYKTKVVRISDSIPKFTDYPLREVPRLTVSNLAWTPATLSAANLEGTIYGHLRPSQQSTVQENE